MDVRTNASTYFRKGRWLSLLLLIGLSTHSGINLAQEVPPAPMDGMINTLDIDTFRGYTFLTTMIHDYDDEEETSNTGIDIDEDGIAAEMDLDYETRYLFPTWEFAEEALDNFDFKNKGRVLGKLTSWHKKTKTRPAFLTKAEMKEFVESKQGVEFQQMYYVLRELQEKEDAAAKKEGRPSYKINLTSVGHFFAFAAGAGTLVTLDDKNYFYNRGYSFGPDGYEKGNERSGRSYSASPEHAANDVSHKKYLDDLEELLEGDEDPLFYEVVLDALLASDVRDLSRLSNLGQSVATDFITVYAAELRRNYMVNLDPGLWEWQNDYIESTLISAYCSSSDGMMAIKQTGKGLSTKRVQTTIRLKKAPLYKWWELNPETKRSGIGKTQYERRLLQKMITTYLRENHGELVETVEANIRYYRKSNGTDIFRAFAEYLNNYKTPAKLKNTRKLTDAMLALVEQIQESADEITEWIHDEYEWTLPQKADKPWDGKRMGRGERSALSSSVR